MLNYAVHDERFHSFVSSLIGWLVGQPWLNDRLADVGRVIVSER